MAGRFLSTLLSLGVGVVGGAIGTGAMLSSAGAFPGTASQADIGHPVTRQVAYRPDSFPIDSNGREPIADLVAHVGSAVVNIDTVSRTAVSYPTFTFPFGGFPFDQAPQGDPQSAPQMVEKGIGSGFIIRQDGLIVTNYHVVRDAQKLTVTFANGKTLKGKVVGKDPGDDLALVKVDAQHLPTLQLEDPRQIRVGEWVVAIGSPLGYQQTVTAGIVSAMNREVGNLNARIGFLQTDAPINPGNSGGPLLDLQGKVVGVNTAIATQAQGIGFAIPVDTLSRVIPDLEAHGDVKHAWLGVGIQDLPPDRSKMFYPASHGAIVMQVTPKGPAAKAGLMQGDIILSVDGKPVTSADDLIRRINDHHIGDRITLEVEREGQEKAFSLSLGQMPDRIAEGR